MKRKERTRILVHSDAAFLRKWAEYFCEQAEFQVLEEPRNALTMIRMRENAQRSVFYLGEVLVSETRIACGDVIGIGLIQGNELEKSYDLAVIDAACLAGLSGVEEFYQALEEERRVQDEEYRKHIAKILKTRVSFETM